MARRQELTGKITEALVAQRQARVLYQRPRSCPHGPRVLPARPAPPRRVHPRVGEGSLARPDCDGLHGQQGCAPLDDARPRSERRTPWDMPKAAARLAVEVPCETAQERFAELTGLSWSDHPVHEVAGELRHEGGVWEVSPTAAEMARRVAERAAGTTWRPVLGLAVEGACVPTRPAQATEPAPGRRHPRATRAGWPGAWQEAKGVRFSLVEKKRIVPLLSWYPVGRADDVGEALRRGQEAGLVPEDQGRWCVLGDGATWIWHQVQALCPTAVQILDDYHCRAHVYQVGGLPVGDDTGQEPAWVEAIMARLFWGDVDGAIEGWETLQPRHREAAEEIRQRIGFLRNSAGRLHDRAARKGG